MLRAGLPWMIWQLQPMEKQHSTRNCLSIVMPSFSSQWIWYPEIDAQSIFLSCVQEKWITMNIFINLRGWIIYSAMFFFLLHNRVWNITVLFHLSCFIQPYFVLIIPMGAIMVAFLKWCSKNIVLIQHLKCTRAHCLISLSLFLSCRSNPSVIYMELGHVIFIFYPKNIHPE